MKIFFYEAWGIPEGYEIRHWSTLPSSIKSVVANQSLSEYRELILIDLGMSGHSHVTTSIFR